MIKRAVNVILALSGLWLGLSAAHASVQFNGINGYAFASDAATFDFSGSFTIELQFQSSVAQNGSLLAKFHQNSGTALDDSYYILVQNDGSIQCRIQTNLQLVTLTAPGSAFDGNWHHVALVYDHAGGISELYYDGTLGASQPLSGELRDTEEAVRIGVLRSSGVLASFFSGQIDEIRFWNVPRRDVQAGCLRAVTLLLDTPGLISYYRFDETSGTTAFDRIAPLENVTLISGATFVTAEPPFASLLDGPGICQCGDISGTLTSATPPVTLVGDTVRVAAGDTLMLNQHALTVDSSVAVVLVQGALISTGIAQSWSFITGQGSPAADAVIVTEGTDTTRLDYTRVSGFASRPLDIRSAINIANSEFANNGGALRIAGYAAINDSRFESQSSYAVQADSGEVRILSTEFVSNSGGIRAQASSGECRVFGDSLLFDANGASDGSALALIGSTSSAVHARIINSTFTHQTGTAAVLIRRAQHVSGETALLESCVFHDNATGTTIVCDTAFNGSSVELRSLSVVLNQAGLQLNTPAILRNSIVIENGADQITGANPLVTYCLTSDTEFHGPGGSFYADPLFEDFFGRDFRLTAGSPAINRGDPSAFYDDDDGSRADIGAYAAANFAPVLESILDVPNDNGRQVMIQWLPSAGDDNRQGISEYRIYREVNLIANFELLATVPAAQLEGYGQIVTTLADSNQNGWPYYTYFVRAQSVNPLAFWDTPLDSGYSVDNLAPEAPALFASQQDDDALLTWTAAPDTDVVHYAIYRADSAFDPDTATVIFATAADTVFVDTSLSGSAHYAVRAVDRNGNFSAASNVASVSFVLTAPQQLTIIPFSTFVWLRWEAVPGATAYQVFRSATPGGPEELVATTPETLYLVPADAAKAFFWVTATRD